MNNETENKAAADKAAAEETWTEINVLIDGVKTKIKAKDLDSKKHTHVSWREFSSDEVKHFKSL